MKKIFSMFFVGLAALTFVSCADDLKEQNINPANVTKTMPEGLLTAAINEFQPNDYLIWYYNVNYFTRWSQMTGGSYADDYTGQAENGGQGGQYLATLKYRNRIAAQIASADGDVKDNGYYAATGILTIYLGIFDTDMYGSIPYTEACHYDDQGILTPKYETVEDLYTLWLKELDEYIALLKGGELNANSKQDAAYGCDWKKWAKLANSLKLKIAVRLLANDQSKALQIAEEAASNSAGLITSTEDDFLFAKATARATGNDDYVYGTGNGLASVSASANVVNYMLASKDPRVRFIYTKNGFNSKVVQSFIDNDRYEDLPRAVKANVILDDEGNFAGWDGMGEPWVRYTALPIQYDAKASYTAGTLSEEDYVEYFNPGVRYQIKVGDMAVTYSPFVYYSTEMRKGRDGFSLPTAITVDEDGNPSRQVIQDTDPNPLYVMYIGAGEVSLYLAELSCIANKAIGGKTYQEWYKAGVTASVEEFDKLASLNKIPYYGTTYNYDPYEVAIDLKAGEIDAMLETDNVKLTGDRNADIEKIYLQQLMHFSEQCDDQYVTARRSGYPKVDSKLLPFVKFPNIALSAIPRRFVISEPLNTDLMYQVKMDAYKAQGFTSFGTNSQGNQYNGGNAPLNTERLWQDKSAPQWGTPKGL